MERARPDCTSGWSYPSWRGPFFPPRLALTKHLAFYAEQFPTTELNGVFYRTPSEDAVSGWVRQTPDKCFRLEGFKIHHSLEAPEGDLTEQP